MRGVSSKLSSAPRICSLPGHSPLCARVILPTPFPNKAFRWLHNGHSGHNPSHNPFQGRLSVQFLGTPPCLGSVPSPVPAPPPCGSLPVHSLTSTAIKQPPSPLLVSATQETFPDLPNTSLGGFPPAPTAHCTSLIRGSTSHRSELVMPIHTAPWLVRGHIDRKSVV